MNRNSELYEDALQRIWILIDDSTDWIAAMSTVVAELHATFNEFSWTGFYRTIRPDHLQVGPYQGSHGCINIPFSSGVCGLAARTKQIQIVADVRQFEGHIACSSTTRSEIVVPVSGPEMSTVAVLDIDSDQMDAFNDIDRHYLELLCTELACRYGREASEAILQLSE